ncbi:hypothetical protein ACS0TY_020170 [Phlomoides rotata]
MATSEEQIAASTTDDDQAVFVDGEMLGPESGDPIQSQTDPDFTTSKELKEQAEEEEGKKESGGEGVHNLKSAFIISGVAVAVIGAIFAIVKKIKEA